MKASVKRLLFLLCLGALYISLMLLGACTWSAPEPLGQATEVTQSADEPDATTPITEPSEETTMEIITEIPTEPETEAPTEPETESEAQPVESITSDWKSMWLSQFDLSAIYTSGGAQRSEADYRTRIEEVLDHVTENGFNSIIVQMRPYADSMYPSEIYPPSRYVTGSYATDFTYDPISILIEEAHERALDVHAWINPLRGMLTSEITQVDASYKIRQWYDDPATNGKYVVVVNNRVYLNPAYPEVRQLIIDGAAEILSRYDVQGLHMDDYFYPTTDASFDATAYTAYKAEGKVEGGTLLQLAAWRRQNLDLLVSGLYSATKAHDEASLFGISPSGVIDTVYNTHYADVYRWCSEEGYLDYICPQVYFGFKHATCAFDRVCDTWQSIIQQERITLIIGMSFGKALSKEDQWAGSGKTEWAESTDIMKRCVEYTLTLDQCVGVSIFCYQYFNDPATGADVAGTAAERANFLPVFKAATWHDDGTEDSE